MSYQVLARKWRPTNFSEVVGQQHVLQALSNALEHQRLHHAYLLSGTRGVGKTTIARIFARSLNCETGVTATPCGKCSHCVDISQGRFVDLLEIDAASRTKVEDTLEILEDVHYGPTAGRYKVYLIDEVHMLSRHSFNALLKTLEEPPAHSIFILATTDPDKLPITVLSRCLQFHLRALTREEITAQLAHILTEEQIAFEEPALGLLAKYAHGSMRDALSLTDQAIAQGDQQVTHESVIQMLGAVELNDVVKLTQLLLQQDAVALLGQLREFVQRMPDIGALLHDLHAFFHQLALYQVAPVLVDSSLLLQEQEVAKLAKTIPAEQLQVWYRMVLEGRKEFQLSSDAFAVVEMLLIRLMQFSLVPPEQALQLAEQQPKSITKPITKSITQPAAVEPVKPTQPQQVPATQPEPVEPESIEPQAVEPVPSKPLASPLSALLATREQLTEDHQERPAEKK